MYELHENNLPCIMYTHHIHISYYIARKKLNKTTHRQMQERRRNFQWKDGQLKDKVMSLMERRKINLVSNGERKNKLLLDRNACAIFYFFLHSGCCNLLCLPKVLDCWNKRHCIIKFHESTIMENIIVWTINPPTKCHKKIVYLQSTLSVGQKER